MAIDRAEASSRRARRDIALELAGGAGKLLLVAGVVLALVGFVYGTWAAVASWIAVLGGIAWSVVAVRRSSARKTRCGREHAGWLDRGMCRYVHRSDVVALGVFTALLWLGTLAWALAMPWFAGFPLLVSGLATVAWVGTWGAVASPAPRSAKVRRVARPAP